jgi:hypothetical protein
MTIATLGPGTGSTRRIREGRRGVRASTRSAAGVTRALVSFGESSLYGLGAPRGADAWT